MARVARTSDTRALAWGSSGWRCASNRLKTNCVAQIRSDSIVDAGQRLEREAGALIAGLVVGASDGNRSGARGSVLVEDDDLGAGIALKLQSEQTQQGALTGTRRSDDERVPDVLDGEVQAEGRVAAGAAADVRCPDPARPCGGARSRRRRPRRRIRA